MSTSSWNSPKTPRSGCTSNWRTTAAVIDYLTPSQNLVPEVRIPTEAVHLFRANASSDSERIRPLIPTQSVHSFRVNPSTP